MPNLERFKQAQAERYEGFAMALSEIKSGRKTSHWIWYIFPQLACLGMSPTAIEYGIADKQEAREYLLDIVLRQRYVSILSAVISKITGPRAVALIQLMGSKIDVLKLISSVTLFSLIAKELNQETQHRDFEQIIAFANALFTESARQGYAPCETTLAAIAAG